MDEMRQTLGHLEPCDVCKEWGDNKTSKTNIYARIRVFMLFCYDVSLDLNFHVVIGVGHLNVQKENFIRQLHFTTHTQYQMQSSFFLDVVVELCPVILNSICIFTTKHCITLCERHFLWNKKQWTKMSNTRSNRICVCKEVWNKTMVIHWSRFRKEVIFCGEDSSQGSWENIAEKMLVEFAESGCPILRQTTPLSRGQLRSKGHGKLSIHYAADLETIETCFCKSAQSLRSNRRDMWKVRILSRKNWTICCYGTINRAQCDQDRSFFWRMMTQHIKNFYCSDMRTN